MSEYEAIIEISAGSRLKYEIDKNSSRLVLDRILSVPCPENYGFIPDTLSPDGDALDVFIMSDFVLEPLSTIKIKIEGVIRMLDNGVEDDKILATIVGEKLDVYQEIHAVDAIEEYLRTYKPGVEILSIQGVPSALDIISKANESYDIQKAEETEFMNKTRRVYT